MTHQNMLFDVSRIYYFSMIWYENLERNFTKVKTLLKGHKIWKNIFFDVYSITKNKWEMMCSFQKTWTLLSSFENQNVYIKSKDENSAT